MSAATASKARWLTHEESQAKGFDDFGLIDETSFSLRSPRGVDETNPTLEGAMKEALRMIMEENVEQVSVVRVKHFEEYNEEISSYEDPSRGSVVISINGDIDEMRDEDED